MVDDGAERGAAVFLYALVWPALAMAAAYFILLSSYALMAGKLVAKRLFGGALASCVFLALLAPVLFSQYGAAFQAKASAASLGLAFVFQLPGLLTLLLGHRFYNKEKQPGTP